MLFAVFVAATVVAAYVVLRFVCGRTVSLALTFFWAVSPWHLQNIPHLRDYSKAPFFMFLLVAMAVAFVERRPRRLLVLGIVLRCRAGHRVRHENRCRAELPAVLHRAVRSTAGRSAQGDQAEVDVRGGRHRAFRGRLVSRSSDLHAKHQLVAHRPSRLDVAIRRQPGHRFPSSGLRLSVRAQRRLHRHGRRDHMAAEVHPDNAARS